MKGDHPAKIDVWIMGNLFKRIVKSWVLKPGKVHLKFFATLMIIKMTNQPESRCEMKEVLDKYLPSLKAMV